MTRVIHTGDTHIGYQQYNSPERRRDFLSAFREVAADAIDDDVDAVIHAGDLFHDRRPGLVDLQGTIEVLRTLADADIPVLAVVGNHETKRDAQWLDLFEDLGLATRLGHEPEVVGDVAFYGLDFVPRSRRDELEYAFAEPPETAHTALVSHGLFEPFAHADWDTATVLSESAVEFDALLLGDNHAADTAEVADTWVTYCGSTERTSASERDARGYNIVEFDDEVAISRRSLSSAREFAFVDVELDEGEGLDRVRERVDEYDLADAVVIVTVRGDGEPFAPATVEEFASERGALVARVNDRRELADESELSVQFADPDAAVDDRIRELGLSDAAQDIDRTVRETTAVAASNIRETVERRVRGRLEDDPDAFEPVDDEPEDSTVEGVGEDDQNRDETDSVDQSIDDGDEQMSTAVTGEPEREEVKPDSKGEMDSEASSETEPKADSEQGSTAGSPEEEDDESDTTDDESDTSEPKHASLGDFA